MHALYKLAMATDIAYINILYIKIIYLYSHYRYKHTWDTILVIESHVLNT